MQLNKTFYEPLKWSLLLAALSGTLFLTGCDRQQQSSLQGGPTVPQVSTVTVQPQEFMLTTQLPGRTSAYRIAEIRPQVSGIIQKRLFKEGSDVKAGQVLYQIDPAPLRAELENAEASHLALRKGADQARSALKAAIADIARLKATLQLARTNKRRYEESYKDKIVSAAQRDQMVTEVKVAEAALLTAEAQVESCRGAVAAADAAIEQAQAAIKTVRINLGYCRVSAPISGRIGRSTVTEGAIVTAYQQVALATIQQMDPIYADVPQSTTELLRLKGSGLNYETEEQNKVKLILEDNTVYPLEGTLQFSDVTVDPTTGSVILRVVFPNPDGVLLPGMFVQTVIKEGIKKEAILIPQQGVSRDSKGNPFALIVDSESKAGMRPLTLDRAIGDKWLVSAGLVPGDRLIVEGMLMLRPGTVVKASPFQETPAVKSPESASDAEPQKQSKGGE